MKMLKLVAAILGIAAAGAMSPLASAGPMPLQFQLTITDVLNPGGSGSYNSGVLAASPVSFSGSVGTWNVTLATGTGSNGSIGLTSVAVSTNLRNTPADLNFTFTVYHNNLAPGVGIVDFLQAMSGILAPDPLSVLSWSATVAGVGGCSSTFTGNGAFGPVSCAFSTGNNVTLDDFTTVLSVSIHHNNDERTSFNYSGVASTRGVPEPGALLLVGVGLIGVAIARRRRTV
jgi:hypothetical protein